MAARLHRCSLGNAAIDAALGMPILLAFLFGITEVSRAMWIQTNIQQAVEDASRCAAVNSTTCGTDTAIKNYAVSHTYAYTVAATNFTVTTPACGRQVAASVPFSSVATGIVGIVVTLTAQSCHPI